MLLGNRRTYCVLCAWPSPPGHQRKNGSHPRNSVCILVCSKDSGKGWWTPKFGGFLRSFLSHPSNPVLSTEKFWDFVFLLHLDSDPSSAPWSSLPTTTSALVTAADSPSNPFPSLLCSAARASPGLPSAQSLTWLPDHLEGKTEVFTTYDTLPKLTSSPVQPQPLSQPGCPRNPLPQ